MNAVVQQPLRVGGAIASEGKRLAAESCHILPSGNRMPLLGLGTWQLNSHTVDAICSAFDAGFRMLDTAADYHTQRGIGEAIRACGIDRDELYVVTKVEPDDDAYAATLRNLAQLRLNYGDLVLIPQPPEHGPAQN